MQIDQDTNDLLRSLNMTNLPGVKMVPVISSLQPVKYSVRTATCKSRHIACLNFKTVVSFPKVCWCNMPLNLCVVDADHSSSTHAHGPPRGQQGLWSASVWTAAIGSQCHVTWSSYVIHYMCCNLALSLQLPAYVTVGFPIQQTACMYIPSNVLMHLVSLRIVDNYLGAIAA